MGALSLPTSHMILHHICRSPPSSSPSLSFLFLKNLRAAPFRLTSSFFPKSASPRILCLSHTLTSCSPSFFSFATTLIPQSLSYSQAILEDPDDASETLDEDIDDFDGGDEIGTDHVDGELDGLKRVLDNPIPKANKESGLKLPVLTVKERKELASYAHSLGKKLKSQQVGKSGVTETVVTALVETLEANELLKLKIHGTCPGELEDVVKQLEGATGSVVVSQIGRTVILYRPSLTKLKAEERKKQGLMKKQSSRPSLQVKGQSKGQLTRSSGRGRRGISRFKAQV